MKRDSKSDRMVECSISMDTTGYNIQEMTTCLLHRFIQKKNHCEGCPLKEECTKGKYKTYGKNIILNELQEKVKENLSTSEGQEMKKERSIQVEGAFGVIKQDMGFTRFTREGMKSVKMEFLLVCIGYNLRKYHLYRIKTDKKEA